MIHEHQDYVRCIPQFLQSPDLSLFEPRLHIQDGIEGSPAGRRFLVLFCLVFSGLLRGRTEAPGFPWGPSL